jgi:hypothetical protein
LVLNYTLDTSLAFVVFSSYIGIDRSYIDEELIVDRQFRLTNFTTRKELDKCKPSAVEPSPCAWQEFAELAFSLSFKTQLVNDLCSNDSTKLIVAQLFERFTNPQLAEESNAAEKIAAILGSLRWTKESAGHPEFTSNDQLPALKRCGRLFEDDHLKDKPFLYIEVYRVGFVLLRIILRDSERVYEYLGCSSV